MLKLKEMGKVSDKDINQVVNQFDKLDPNNLGKITLPDLLGELSICTKHKKNTHLHYL